MFSSLPLLLWGINLDVGFLGHLVILHWILRWTARLFSTVSISILPRALISPHPHQPLSFSVVFSNNHVMGVMWSLLVVWLHFSDVQGIEHLFMCVWSFLCKSFAQFLLVLLLLLWSCRISLYILDVSPLSAMWLPNIFSCSVGCIFILWSVLWCVGAGFWRVVRSWPGRSPPKVEAPMPEGACRLQTLWGQLAHAHTREQHLCDFAHSQALLEQVTYTVMKLVTFFRLTRGRGNTELLGSFQMGHKPVEDLTCKICPCSYQLLLDFFPWRYKTKTKTKGRPCIGRAESSPEK